MRSFDADERRARLAERHLLLPRTRTDDLPAIADAVVALHSSDPVSVFLSAFARMTDPSVGRVEEALYEQRSLIRHHAMRRTLWVATADTVRLMHAAATVRLVAPERRRTAALLAESGVADPDTWLDDAETRVLADLAEHGPSTARELGARVDALRQPLSLAPGKRWAQTQSAHTRVLLGLGFAGGVVRARPSSWVNGAYRYARAEDWLPGGVVGADPAEAEAELLRRWLRRFGPATTGDVSWWTGWTLKTTRTALATARAVPVEIDGAPAWVAEDDGGSTDPQPWVAALPSLDPSTMGWKQRDWYLPAAAADAFDRNGNAGPTLWVDGRVVGAWAMVEEGRARTHYFERVGPARRAELDERLAMLQRAVGGSRFTVRFPGLINARLTEPR